MLRSHDLGGGSTPSCPTSTARVRCDGRMSDLSHVDESAAVRMVDVGEKPHRPPPGGRARVRVRMAAATRRQRLGALPKGDALTTAQLAGIMAAEADERSDPALPPAAADGRSTCRLEVVAARRRDHGHGRDDRADAASRWRRSYAASVAALHRLRHGEGDRQGDDDRRRHAGREDARRREDGRSDRLRRRPSRARARTSSGDAARGAARRRRATRSSGGSCPTRRREIAARDRGARRDELRWC